MSAYTENSKTKRRAKWDSYIVPMQATGLVVGFLFIIALAILAAGS